MSDASALSDEDLRVFAAAIVDNLLCDPAPELGRKLDCLIVDDVACARLHTTRDALEASCHAHVAASMARHAVTTLDGAACAESEAAGWSVEDAAAPPFLVHLLASAFVGVRVDDETESTNRFRESLADTIPGHRLGAGLEELGGLWDELAAWSRRRHAEDRSRFELALPDPGGWTRVGYSRRFVVPSRRDTLVLARAIERFERVAPGWPVHEVERFLRQERSTLGALHEPLHRRLYAFWEDVVLGVPDHELDAARVLRQVEALGIGSGVVSTRRNTPKTKLVGMWRSNAFEPLTLFLVRDRAGGDDVHWETSEVDVGVEGFGHLVLAKLASSDATSRLRAFVERLLSKDPPAHVERGATLVDGTNLGILVFVRVPGDVQRYVQGLDDLESGRRVRLLVRRGMVDKVRSALADAASTMGHSSPDFVESTVPGWCEFREMSSLVVVQARESDSTFFRLTNVPSYHERPISLFDGLGAHGTWLGQHETLPRLVVARRFDRVTMRRLGRRHTASEDDEAVVCAPVPHEPTPVSTWFDGDVEGTWRIFATNTSKKETSIRDVVFVDPMFETGYRRPRSPAHFWTEDLVDDGARLDVVVGRLDPRRTGPVDSPTHVPNVSTRPTPPRHGFWRLSSRWRYKALKRTGITLPEAISDLNEVLGASIPETFALLHAWSAALMLDWCHSCTWPEQRLFLRESFFLVVPETPKAPVHALLLGWTPHLLDHAVAEQASALKLVTHRKASASPHVPSPLVVSAGEEGTREGFVELVAAIARTHGLEVATSVLETPRIHGSPFEVPDADDLEPMRRELTRYDAVGVFDFERWRTLGIDDADTPIEEECVVTHWKPKLGMGGGANIWLVHRSRGALDEVPRPADVLFATHSRSWALVSAWAHRHLAADESLEAIYERVDDSFVAREGTRLALPRAVLFRLLVESDSVPAPAPDTLRWTFRAPDDDTQWFDELASGLPGSFLGYEDVSEREGDEEEGPRTSDDDMTDTPNSRRVRTVRFPTDVARNYGALASTISNLKLGSGHRRAKAILKRRRKGSEYERFVYVTDHISPMWITYMMEANASASDVLTSSEVVVSASLYQSSLAELAALVHVVRHIPFDNYRALYSHALEIDRIEHEALVRTSVTSFHLSMPNQFLNDGKSHKAWLEELSALFPNVDVDFIAMGVVTDSSTAIGLLAGREDAHVTFLEACGGPKVSERLRTVADLLLAVGRGDWEEAEAGFEALRDGSRLVLHGSSQPFSPAWRLMWARCAWHREDWRSVCERLLSGGGVEFVHSTLPLIMVKRAWVAAGHDAGELPEVPEVAHVKTNSEWWRLVKKTLVRDVPPATHSVQSIASKVLTPHEHQRTNEPERDEEEGEGMKTNETRVEDETIEETREAAALGEKGQWKLTEYVAVCRDLLTQSARVLEDGTFDGPLTRRTANALTELYECVLEVLVELNEGEGGDLEERIDLEELRVSFEEANSGFTQLHERLSRVGFRDDAEPNPSAFETFVTEGYALLRGLEAFDSVLGERVGSFLEAVGIFDEGGEPDQPWLETLSTNYGLKVILYLSSLTLSSSPERRLFAVDGEDASGERTTNRTSPDDPPGPTTQDPTPQYHARVDPPFASVAPLESTSIEEPGSGHVTYTRDGGDPNVAVVETSSGSREPQVEEKPPEDVGTSTVARDSAHTSARVEPVLTAEIGTDEAETLVSPGTLEAFVRNYWIDRGGSITKAPWHEVVWETRRAELALKWLELVPRHLEGNPVDLAALELLSNVLHVCVNEDASGISNVPSRHDVRVVFSLLGGRDPGRGHNDELYRLMEEFGSEREQADEKSYAIARLRLVLEALTPQTECWYGRPSVEWLEATGVQEGFCGFAPVLEKLVEGRQNSRLSTIMSRIRRELTTRRQPTEQEARARLDGACAEYKTLLTELRPARFVERTHCRKMWKAFMERHDATFVRFYDPDELVSMLSRREALRQEVDALPQGYVELAEHKSHRVKFQDRSNMDRRFDWIMRELEKVLEALDELAEATERTTNTSTKMFGDAQKIRRALGTPVVGSALDELSRILLERAIFGTQPLEECRFFEVRAPTIWAFPELVAMGLTIDGPRGSDSGLSYGSIASMLDDESTGRRLEGLVVEYGAEAVEELVERGLDLGELSKLERLTGRIDELGLLPRLSTALAALTDERGAGTGHRRLEEDIARMAATQGRIANASRVMLTLAIGEQRELEVLAAHALGHVHDVEDGEFELETSILDAWLTRVREWADSSIAKVVAGILAREENADASVLEAFDRGDYNHALSLLDRGTDGDHPLEEGLAGNVRATPWRSGYPVGREVVRIMRARLAGDAAAAEAEREDVKALLISWLDADVTDGGVLLGILDRFSQLVFEEKLRGNNEARYRHLKGQDNGTIFAYKLDHEFMGSLRERLGTIDPTFLPFVDDVEEIVLACHKRPIAKTLTSFMKNQGKHTKRLHALLLPSLDANLRTRLVSTARTNNGRFVVIDDTDLSRLFDSTDPVLGFFEIALEQQRLGGVNPFAVHEGTKTRMSMFVGRAQQTEELVSGRYSRLFSGRKLGKTALLKHVESKSPHPTKDAQRHVVYLPIAGIDNPTAFRRVLEDSLDTLESSAGLVPVKKRKRPKSLLDDREATLETIRIFLAAHPDVELLVVCDEADVFVESEVEAYDHDKEKILTFGLRELGERVDFVFSGYRSTNTRGGAWGNWGDVLTLEPLSTQESVELLVVPLARLGVDVGNYAVRIARMCGHQPAILLRFGRLLVEHLEAKSSRKQARERLVVEDDDVTHVYHDESIRHEIRHIVGANFQGNTTGEVVFRALLKLLATRGRAEFVEDVSVRILEVLEGFVNDPDEELSWLGYDRYARRKRIDAELAEMRTRGLVEARRGSNVTEACRLRHPVHLPILLEEDPSTNINASLRNARSKQESFSLDRVLYDASVLLDIPDFTAEGAGFEELSPILLAHPWTTPIETRTSLRERLDHEDVTRLTKQRRFVTRATPKQWSELWRAHDSDTVPVVTAGIEVLRRALVDATERPNLERLFYSVQRLGPGDVRWWFERPRALEFEATDAVDRIMTMTAGIPWLLGRLDDVFMHEELREQVSTAQLDGVEQQWKAMIEDGMLARELEEVLKAPEVRVLVDVMTVSLTSPVDTDVTRELDELSAQDFDDFDWDAGGFDSSRREDRLAVELLQLTGFLLPPKNVGAFQIVSDPAHELVLELLGLRQRSTW